ncbi:cadherin-17 [Notechis scutatus]|uniref:Cadherin-17 n=1 Tax=Notechis scutatus TaxID=8663 RepID=A0A6J1VU85_9SAUR|nr:cadherin-17 [Notechis scutatus]
MFKLNGLNLLCLLSLHQVACLLEEKSQLSGPLENKVFYVEEGRTEPQYLYRFTFEPPTYSVSLISEADHLMEVTPKDGVLFVNGLLDWEKKPQYRLQLEGLDQYGKRVQGPYSIIINVVDINDNAPEFNKSAYSGEVRQHFRPGKPFMYVTAFDRDDPSTLHSELSYSILQQFPTTREMYFQIDNVTGAISTTDAGTKNLDPTVRNQFILVVTAKDMAGQSINSFATNVDVKITVLENLWKSPPEVLLLENSTMPHPMNITHVQWNDPYATYTIQPKEKPSFEVPFTVDQNGTVYVTKPLDREEKDHYLFYISANDEEGDSLAEPVIVSVRVIDINDNPPVCDKVLTKFEVQENEDVGNLIGIVLASDNDKKGSLNSRLQFSLLDQTPKIPQDNLFRIESGTGAVHLFKSKLNRQVAETYSLKVNVTDSVFSTICDLQIQVIDINDKIPIFEKSDYGTVIVAEDRKKGSLIFKIQATDDDEPFTGSSQIIYTITKGDPSNSFKILTDPETNIGSIIINKGLDFETNSVYNLTINATNPEPLVDGIKYNSSSSTFLLVLVINVEEPPVFLHPSHIVMLYENVTIGSNVTTIKAFDPEGYPIRYWLKNPDRNWLEIDPVNGHVYTAAPLDFELYKSYIVDIVATEQSEAFKSSVTQLILHLLDVNDNPPYLVNENVFLCHPLQKDKSAKFEVADPDSEIPKFTYSLIGREYEDNWIISKVDDKHASITPRNLKLEQKVYEVPLKISDNGRPPMEAVVNLKVDVCRCVDDNSRCFIEIENPNSFPTVGATIGILVGVLVVIGVILGLVFFHLDRKKKNEKNITPIAIRSSELDALT